MNDWEAAVEMRTYDDGLRSDQMQQDDSPASPSAQQRRRPAKQPFLRRGEGVQRRMTAYQRRKPTTPQPDTPGGEDGPQRSSQQRGRADQSPAKRRSASGSAVGRIRSFDDADAPARGGTGSLEKTPSSAWAAPHAAFNTAATARAAMQPAPMQPAQQKRAWLGAGVDDDEDCVALGSGAFDDDYEDDLQQHPQQLHGGFPSPGCHVSGAELTGETQLLQHRDRFGFDLDPGCGDSMQQQQQQQRGHPRQSAEWEGLDGADGEAWGVGGCGVQPGLGAGASPLAGTPLSSAWDDREAEEVREGGVRLGEVGGAGGRGVCCLRPRPLTKAARAQSVEPAQTTTLSICKQPGS